jgi:hypothetical protein
MSYQTTIIVSAAIVSKREQAALEVELDNIGRWKKLPSDFVHEAKNINSDIYFLSVGYEFTQKDAMRVLHNLGVVFLHPEEFQILVKNEFDDQFTNYEFNMAFGL